MLSLDSPYDTPAGTKVDTDFYLGGFLTAYGWSGNDWVRIGPDPTDDPDRPHDDDPALEIEKGYRVYYEEDTIITPRNYSLG